MKRESREQEAQHEDGGKKQRVGGPGSSGERPEQREVGRREAEEKEEREKQLRR